MNPKQTIPAIAKIAPPLLVGVVIFMAIKSLFSDDDTEKKPETTPANSKPENRRKEAQTTPPPLKKNFVTRKTLASVFDHGARTLTRKDAVAALNRLGFGKTAAYAALSENGRFSAWLRFAPDGIITWTDR